MNVEDGPQRGTLYVKVQQLEASEFSVYSTEVGHYPQGRRKPLKNVKVTRTNEKMHILEKSLEEAQRMEEGYFRGGVPVGDFQTSSQKVANTLFFEVLLCRWSGHLSYYLIVLFFHS